MFNFCSEIRNYQIVSPSTDRIFKPSIELTLSEKFQSPLVPLIVKIEHNIGSAIKHSKQIAHPKPKVCLLKNALKNVEEVKGANEIKQIISI